MGLMCMCIESKTVPPPGGCASGGDVGWVTSVGGCWLLAPDHVVLAAAAVLDGSVGATLVEPSPVA